MNNPPPHMGVRDIDHSPPNIHSIKSLPIPYPIPMLLITALFCILLSFAKIAETTTTTYYGGIPVPGRRVPAIRMFELFLNSCRSSPTLEKLSKLIRSVDADQLAEKLQRNLYFAVDDVDIEALMGKWYTVIFTPMVQSDHCVISYYKLLDQSAYSASFSTTQYSLRASDAFTKLAHGTGRKYAPDPGSVLIGTGQASEPCPYFPVKIGPINKSNGQYAYMVLTQALKQPTLVIARDPDEFALNNLLIPVIDYLRRFGYWHNPLTGTELQSADWAKCDRSGLFYTQIEDDEQQKSEWEGGMLGQMEGIE